MRDVVLAGERFDGAGGRGVHAGGDEPLVVPMATADRGDRALRSRQVVVGHHHPVEELTTRSDTRKRVADAARPDEEYPHGR